MESPEGVDNARPSVLSSVNSATGAMIGAAAALAFLVAGIATEMVVGRPSPDQMAGTIVFGLPILTALGALAGALIGWVGRRIVRQAARVGQWERSIVAGTLVLVVLIAGLSGVWAVRQAEARSQPRVMHSTGAVTRLAGFGPLTRDDTATLVFSSGPNRELGTLAWREGTVGVRLDGETLTVSRDSAVVAQVSLDGLDYVRGVYGVTAIDEQGQEWLALLVRLRATGRRELLLIYDSAGALVHEELLARTKSGPAPVLWSVDRAAGDQGFLIDLGEPLQYVIRK